MGDSIQLVGYDLTPLAVEPGGSLSLTLYWQALEEMDTSYTIFVHLIDEQGWIWGQNDGLPQGGALPTGTWLPGEFIIEERTILLSLEALPGEYLLEVGLYLLETGERLPVYDAQGLALGDRLLLSDRVRVP